MKLPNGERAVIEPNKLYAYCLNPQHRYGRHKARMFQSVLGITVANWHLLRDALLDAARRLDAVGVGSNPIGVLYRIDFPLTGPTGAAVVRSGWIIHHDEQFPRLTTCFVLE